MTNLHSDIISDLVPPIYIYAIFIILYLTLIAIYKLLPNSKSNRCYFWIKIIVSIIFIALPFIGGLALYYIRTIYYPSEKDQFFSDVIYNPSIALLIPLFFILLQKLDELLTEKDNKPTIKIKTESANIESSSTHLNANEIEVAAENIDVSSAQINVDAKNTTANATQANIVSSKADIKTQNATILNVAESSDTKEPK